MKASTQAPDDVAVISYAVDSISVDPDNARRRHDSLAFGDLVASVAEKGVLQPLIVRQGETDAHQHRLVCGHRRLAAAKQVGLRHVPCIFMHLGDNDAREIQLIENLQRADLHPMDEAEAFERLHRESGRTIEEVAARVGRSPSFVAQRMKLLSLCPQAREAFLADKISAGVALLVARIPEGLQERALLDLEPDSDGTQVALAGARHLIQRTFMLELKGAPFRASDAHLLAGVGACGDCPKRTGSNPLLFSDVERGDTCTDPECFRAKSDAAWAAARAKAEANGVECLDDSEGKHSDWSGRTFSSAKFVDPTEKQHIHGAGPERVTWRSLVPKGQEPPTTLVRLKSGKQVKVWARAEAEKIARAAGTLKDEREPGQKSPKAAAAEHRNLKVNARTTRLVKASALKALRGGLEDKRSRNLAMWLLGAELAEAWDWVWAALGRPTPEDDPDGPDPRKLPEDLQANDLIALAFASAIDRELDNGELAAMAGLKLEKVRKIAEDELAREEAKLAKESAGKAGAKSGKNSTAKKGA